MLCPRQMLLTLGPWDLNTKRWILEMVRTPIVNHCFWFCPILGHLQKSPDIINMSWFISVSSVSPYLKNTEHCEFWCLVGGLEHEFYDFPFSWECHDPNWRTHIFQRGRSTTNQMCIQHFEKDLIPHPGSPLATTVANSSSRLDLVDLQPLDHGTLRFIQKCQGLATVDLNDILYYIFIYLFIYLFSYGTSARAPFYV